MKKYFLAILLTVLTTFAFSSRAGAVSDISYTVDSSNASTYHLLCNTSTPCSDYSYLKVSFSSTSVDLTTGSLPYLRLYYFYNSTMGSKNLDLYFSSTSQSYYVPITSAMYQIDYRNGTFLNANLAPGWSVVLTLTNDLGEPCPECLPPDRSAIMDDFHNVFLNVFVGVIPISAIIFVVWFMIDMLSSLMFGRGK